MVQRNANSTDDEPEQREFELPSEDREHLFQVSDILNDFQGDPDIFYAKCEVVGGDEEGRTLLNRLSVDDTWKGFFATQLFLKAINEPYKGKDFPIDTEKWQGRQFYATVIHDGKYANICEYNFDKIIEQSTPPSGHATVDKPGDEEVEWDKDL